MIPCFDSSKDYELWRRTRDRWAGAGSQNLASFGDHVTECTDCTPERQREMVKQRRCMYPATFFVPSVSAAECAWIGVRRVATPDTEVLDLDVGDA